MKNKFQGGKLMAFNPYTNDKDKNYSHIRKKFDANKIPDILSQAETIVNDFITKPPKHKKTPFLFLASMYLSGAVLVAAAYLLIFLK